MFRNEQGIAMCKTQGTAAAHLQGFPKLLHPQTAQLWGCSMQSGICYWHRLGEELHACIWPVLLQGRKTSKLKGRRL